MNRLINRGIFVKTEGLGKNGKNSHMRLMESKRGGVCLIDSSRLSLPIVRRFDNIVKVRLYCDEDDSSNSSLGRAAVGAVALVLQVLL